MRKLFANLLFLGIVLNSASALAGHWDQRQPMADRGARHPLLVQRRPPQSVLPRQSTDDTPRFQPLPKAPVVERPPLQPADAARRAQQQYGGRVLSVSPSDNGYHVRLLREGEVSVVTVPN